MHLHCFFLVKIVAIYALLVCKVFGPKIRPCKFFDKYQVWCWYVGKMDGCQDVLISSMLGCPSAVSDWINFPKLCLRELPFLKSKGEYEIQLHFGGFQSCTVQPCDFKSCTVAKFLNFQSPPAVRFNPRCNLLARRISQMLIAAEFWHFPVFNRWLGPMMCMWAGTFNMSCNQYQGLRILLKCIENCWVLKCVL